MTTLLSRRHALMLLGAAALLPIRAYAGGQREEHLAANVASSMRRSIDNPLPPKLVFSTPQAGYQWLEEMGRRLERFGLSQYERTKILTFVQYEAKRAGLDPQLVLGLIEVESRFRRYAISSVGARGLMQVMPFWVRQIGHPDQDLFEIRTNLRYGCTILRYYLDRERGDMFRALARYNGSLGQSKYPNAVLGAWQRNWQYQGPQ